MNKIKAVGDWELSVLAIPFGGPNNKDLDGEYFDASTDLHLDKFPDPLIIYHHGHNQEKAEVIGKTLSHEVKPDGLWLRIRLDQANKFAARVWRAAKQNLAAASSGSIAHLVRKAKDGFISAWPFVELSLFDIDASQNRQPANPSAIAIPAKSLYSLGEIAQVYKQAGRTLPDIDEEVISDDECKALQARAKAVLAELEARKWIDAVDDALVKIAFDREPTELERKYEDAAIGAVNFYANTRIKSLPVRFMDLMVDAHDKAFVRLGQYDFFGNDTPMIILNGNRNPIETYKTFLHETGHAIDRQVIGYKAHMDQGYNNREAAADEYRRLLNFTAWRAACTKFYGGSSQVKSITVDKLLLALTSLKS